MFRVNSVCGVTWEEERDWPSIHSVSECVCVMCRLDVIPAGVYYPSILWNLVPAIMCRSPPWFTSPSSFSPLALSLSVMCSGVSAGTENGSDWVSDSSRGCEGDREREGRIWGIGKDKLTFWGVAVSILQCECVSMCLKQQMLKVLSLCWCVPWVRYILKCLRRARCLKRNCCCNLSVLWFSECCVCIQWLCRSQCSAAV